MRRRLNLAAPAVREHVLAHHKDIRRRLQGLSTPEELTPDDFELRVMAGEPVDIRAWQLPGELHPYGLTVHDTVRVYSDGQLQKVPTE